MRGIEKEIRCGNCGRLLAKGTAIALEIKCPRCGEIKYVRDMIPGSEPHDGHRSLNNEEIDRRQPVLRRRAL
jgi:phage FluMu protein Com